MKIEEEIAIMNARFLWSRGVERKLPVASEGNVDYCTALHRPRAPTVDILDRCVKYLE